MSYKTTLESSLSLGIAREVSVDGQRCVCYTKYSETDQQWIIGVHGDVCRVSDCKEVWRNGLSEKDMNDRAGSRGVTSYLSNLSQALREGEVCLSKAGDVLTVTLKCIGGDEVFRLNQVTEREIGLEITHLLFYLVGELQSTRARLKVCEKEVEDSKKRSAANQPVYADVSMKSSASKAVGRPKRTVGTSLVNPSSKRRKAATGVVFDSNSQNS